MHRFTYSSRTSRRCIPKALKSGSMVADEQLIRLLDAGDEYLAAIDRLSDSLRSAHFTLAQAKYSMGADTVGLLHYDSVIEATRFVRQQPIDTSETKLVLSEAECITPRRPENKEAAADRSCSADSAASRDSEQTALPTLQSRSEYSSLLNELAEKFCVSDTAYSAADDESDPPKRQRTEPLRWFRGGLVSSSLRSAQMQFKEAVALAVEAANCQAALRRAVSS